MSSIPKYRSLIRSVILATVLTFAICSIQNQSVFSEWTWNFDAKFYDLYSQLNIGSISATKSESILLDGLALQKYGFPFDRINYANAIETLSRKFEKQPIIIDVIFGESKQQNSTRILYETMKKSTRPIIVASTISDQWQPKVEVWNQNSAYIFQESALGLDGPYPPILNKNLRIGISDIYSDDDGIVRWYPLVQQVGGTWVPSLALAAWTSSTGKHWTVQTENGGIKSINLDNIKLDLSSDPMRLGRILINAKQKSDYWPSFSLADLDDVDIKDKSIFIGTSVDGLRSFQPTAVDVKQVPIHTHQFVFEDLMNGRILNRNNSIQLIYVYFGFLVLFISISRYINIGIWGILSTNIAVMISSLITGFLCFKFQVFCSPFLPMAATLTNISVGVLLKLRRTEKDKEFIKKSFAHYLHPDLVEKLISNNKLPELRGDKKTLTVMFVDMRNFTSLSEKLTPTSLVSVMNEFFDLISTNVQRNEGTVDKFIGDAVMAFWNAPNEVEGREEKAFVATQEILNQFRILQQKWRIEFNLEDTPTLGIGLHTGEAIVGNIGGDGRFNYTALGDDVNIASRIEGLCKTYSVSCLISDSFVSNLSNSEFRTMFLDEIYLKGKKNSTKLFTLKDEVTQNFTGEWSKFYKHYGSGDFENATELLLKHNEWPWNSEFAYRINMLKDLPQRDWNGIWKMTSK